MPWYKHLVFTLLMVFMGMAFEVIFTALMDMKAAGDKRLKGYTYVWMIPIYALVYPLLHLLYPYLSAWGFVLRGAFYVALIFVVEYVSGWLLRRTTGECPWEREYRGHKYAVHGLIRLDFAPAWFVAVMLFEFVFRVLRDAI